VAAWQKSTIAKFLNFYTYHWEDNVCLSLTDGVKESKKYISCMARSSEGVKIFGNHTALV